MKLDDIEKLDTEFLDIPTVAAYLKKSQQSVRESIRAGVPWGYVMGAAAFRIPKRAFVNYHKYGNHIITEKGV
jgi:hypothetical protein